MSPVDGLLYGLTNTAPPKLVQINPTTGAVQNINFVGTPPTELGGYGASWFTATGDLIEYDNGDGTTNSGRLYQIDLTDPTHPTVLAGLTPPLPGPSSGGNDGAACVARTRTADLSVSKTANPSPSQPNTTLTYTVSVVNNGPDSAQTPTVTDHLPAGATFISATGTGWNCAQAAGVVTCTSAKDVPLGPAPDITIKITTPSNATSVTNTADVSSPTTDPDMTNNHATVTTSLGPVADLSVIKDSNPNPYVPGQTLTYTVTVTNAGPSDVTGAKVDDTLPAVLAGAGFTWICSTPLPNACGATSGAGDIHTTVNLLNGSQAIFTLTGTVPSNTTGAFTNSATVTPPPGTNDPNTSNNTDDNNNPANVTADLAITKVSSPNPYVPGQILTYTVTVTNNGPSDVTGAKVSDPLPGILKRRGLRLDVRHHRHECLRRGQRHR